MVLSAIQRISIFYFPYGDAVMSLLVSTNYTRPEDWRGQQQLIEYLSSLGQLTHSVTISLKPVYLRSHIWERYEYEKAAIVFVRRINSFFFGKRFNRGKKALPIITSFEAKRDLVNPHLHIAVGCPESSNSEEFERVIRDTHRKIRLFNQHIHIQPYRSSGWIGYLSKEGQDSLVLSCCNSGK